MLTHDKAQQSAPSFGATMGARKPKHTEPFTRQTANGASNNRRRRLRGSPQGSYRQHPLRRSSAAMGPVQSEFAAIAAAEDVLLPVIWAVVILVSLASVAYMYKAFLSAKEVVDDRRERPEKEEEERKEKIKKMFERL
eukprot:evm.model.scf_150EXC.4 EVM.evm.TU.scf_150EXC.4   scf_150EXC:29505-29918(-)